MLAKSLRKNQTDSESYLWKYLRNRQFKGLKFRRQFPIGCYILDFFCVEKRIAIELDGGQHSKNEALRKDKAREEFLQRCNIKIIRFWDNDILKNIGGVLQKLEEEIPKNIS
ncbi:DNA (cytosine-5-)-methyltransferase [candidate division WWE3 bacterium CG_4_10_14_0_2_um_filter_42_8]|uniref:DNA (Cytosine-5-)-methyltransferase n=1 Tax=candidate division WWE3 bacterium CG_4_10_14_0_2_um_filter_42_8 TaxID=1975074 RepID=A0A2M7TB06_UNCKA|nr:MAG: DNA (cytosine-5-)-methyltransferase [candidate division WWE3 bacterium CG_4_10_14_0_2_um_filter_42_8]